MIYDPDDEVARWLEDQSVRAIPSLMTKMVHPWVKTTVAEVLEGKALSAGPTRGGERVQVRYRLGHRFAASSHPLSLLRDGNMDYFPPQKVIPLIRAQVIHAVIRPDKIEERLRSSLRDHLQGSCKNIPPDIVERALIRHKAAASVGKAYQGELWRISHGHVQAMDVACLVLSSDEVIPAMEALLVRASELAVSVPYHVFPDSRRRLRHTVAKRKLLRAMKVALLAGVTDAELEDIKNEALINQIMS